MGSVCCCFCAEDFEDWANPNSSSYRNCPCLRCLVNSFIYVYTSLSQREDLHSVRSPLQGAASMTSSSLLDNSLSDTYHSPPRPSPYHSDQQGSSVPRHEKGSSYSNEETEPLRNGSDADSDSFSSGDKWKSSALIENSKEEHDKSSLKLSSEKSKIGLGYFYSSIEDEDVCPTCLEEYTSENPKIITKCSHHFHLGCIYEWMERSDCCPVCGKVMIFDEKT